MVGFFGEDGGVGWGKPAVRAGEGAEEARGEGMVGEDEGIG